MSLAVVYSRGKQGIKAPLVAVEVHLSGGLPSLSIVGLPEAAVKESKDRVRGALLSSRFEFPVGRITVNLAPADLPKEGGRFDLPIALGILAASGQVNAAALAAYECVGELSLGGALRPVAGILPVVMAATAAGRQVIVPEENGAQAALVDAEVYLAEHLLGVCAHLNAEQPLSRLVPASKDPLVFDLGADLADVHGHQQAKRALEIAAAGRHNVLMIGPPGTGKSMLAARLPGLLPALNESEALESATVASVGQVEFDPRSWRRPPFRAPHHSASPAALVGGGSNPSPGEVSIAHNGVLFLDELPEFDRKVLEVLREPLETGVITISRATRRVDYPARFQLIAAMNPCPCGFQNDGTGRCRCTPDQIERYRGKISGPLLDRIDMHVEVPRIDHELIRRGAPGGEEPSATVRQRVCAARDRAVFRSGCANGALEARQVKQHCVLDEAGDRLLAQAMSRFGLSHRAYHRILKVARTIADLSDSDAIGAAHVAEAISYRRLDRPVTSTST